MSDREADNETNDKTGSDNEKDDDESNEWFVKSYKSILITMKA